MSRRIGGAVAVAALGVALAAVGCKSPKPAVVDSAGARDTRVGEPGAEPPNADLDGADQASDRALTVARQLCQDLCGVTAQVPCAASSVDCVRSCEASIAEGACGTEAMTLARCKLTLGPSGYTCVAGLVVMVPGQCQVEINDYRACGKRDAGA